jgi:glycosyltransferase involved in cell wall biosynthesis
MKVLLIGSMYPPYAFGGAEKAIALLAEALVQKGREVVVVCLYPESIEKVEERHGIRVYYLPLDNGYWPFTQRAKPNPLLRIAWHLREMWNWKAASRVGKILDREKPDVVHTHNISGFSVAIWRAVKRRQIRLVHTMHDYYLLCPRTTLYRGGKSCENRCIDCKLLTASRKVASRLPDEVVSVSQFTLDKHKSLGLFRNTASRVVYNVQPQISDAMRRIVTTIRSDQLRFGFIGRIEPEKGIEAILRATRHLVRDDWRLKIAGKGTDDYIKYLRDKYTDKRIEWLGFMAASDFYQVVDVVIIPSQWNEPLPYVCVESVHEGKALICAQVGGLPEIGRLSRLIEYFQPGDIEELARLMNGALDDQAKWKERRPLSSGVLEQFTQRAVVERYLSAYQFAANTNAMTSGDNAQMPHYPRPLDI